MTTPYHDGQIELQERFDTRRLADRLAEASTDTFRDEFARFIEARDMFFIASTDPDGNPDCSYKGGDPGFVRVVDERTLAFPMYDGNGMFRTLGNLAAHPRVGLLFIDFEEGSRLRVNGDANVAFDDPLGADHPGALCVVRVRAERDLRQLPPIRARVPQGGGVTVRATRRRRAARARLEARPVVRRHAGRRRPRARPAPTQRAGDAELLNAAAVRRSWRRRSTRRPRR